MKLPSFPTGRANFKEVPVILTDWKLEYAKELYLISGPILRGFWVKPSRGGPVSFLIERANCPMAFDVGETLGHDLAWFDILEARGSLEFPQRTKLLVVAQEPFFDEDQQLLKVDHFSLEGFGFHQIQVANLAIPSVEKLVEDVLILWDVQGTIPPLGEAVWIMGVSEMEFLQEWHFITAAVAFWLPVLERLRSPSSIRLLELCAGGDISVAGTWCFLDVEVCALPLLADVGVDARTFVAPLTSIPHHQGRVLDFSSRGHGGAIQPNSDGRCCEHRYSCLCLGLNGSCFLGGECWVLGHCDSDLGSLWIFMDLRGICIGYFGLQPLVGRRHVEVA